MRTTIATARAFTASPTVAACPQRSALPARRPINPHPKPTAAAATAVGKNGPIAMASAQSPKTREMTVDALAVRPVRATHPENGVSPPGVTLPARPPPPGARVATLTTVRALWV